MLRKTGGRAMGIRAVLLIAVAMVLAGAFAAAGGASVSTRGSGSSAQLACTDTWTNTAGGDWATPGKLAARGPKRRSQGCITAPRPHTGELGGSGTHARPT